MKAFLHTFLLLTMVLAMVSCSKDKDKTVDTPLLSGTTWKCSTNLDWDENLEYLMLKFTSSNTVEGWSKYQNEDQTRDWIGSYTQTNDSVTIYEGENGEIITGNISGVNMNLADIGAAYSLTFTLQ